MAIYPGAVYKPTSFGGHTPRIKGQRGILHVAVSGARSLPPWNQNTWHFYVAADGYCEQYVDTDWCAWASVDANTDALSIETQGGLGTSAQVNAEPWTPAAAARIADIMRWANATEGIPLAVLPDSKAGRRGWGPHRLGINPWRVAGGQVWSNSNGKECPGDTKVAQVADIIRLAQQGDDFMATMSDAEKADLMELVRVFLPGKSGRSAGPGWLRVDSTSAAVAKLLAKPGVSAADIAAAIPLDLAAQVTDELAKRLNSPAA